MSKTQCFHCSLPAPEPVVFFAEVEGKQQPMCCPGCKAVTEAIIAGGLENYYQHRTESANPIADLSQRILEELRIYDRPEIQKDFVQPVNNIQNDDSRLVANLLIEGITCAACVWLLENHLQSLDGVERVIVNLSTHEAQVTWHSDQIPLSDILLAIHRIGYKAYPWRADHQEAMLKQENRTFIRRLAVAGLGAMQVMMYAIALYSGAISNDMPEMYRNLLRVVSAIVATPVVFYAAAPFFKAAWRNIKTRHLGMDVPVSIAIGGAYLASLWATFFANGEVYYDSVSMFTFFLLTGRYLELRARHATARAARALTNLMPPSCLKEIDGEFVRVPVSELQPNDKVRILPGDAIPADGILLSGSTSVNESMLTGEYLPIEKQTGDTLLCSSLNVDHPVEIQVTKIGDETRVASIIKLLQRAQQDKPAIAKLADKVAGWFVAAVLLVAICVYWGWSGVAPEDAFWITLSVLVVTCPCALSLATPAALTAATGYLHKLGLLVTRGHVLEGLHTIDHVIFDKTGTLTKGELSLTQVIPIEDCTLSLDQLTAMAAALEAHSEHPIARAFSITSQTFTASEVKNHLGMGIEGTINQQQLRIGRPDFAFPQSTLKTPETDGKWLLLADDNKPLCWFRITDSLRPEAAATVKRLQKMGKTVILLSGDTESIVANTAESLGIKQWQAGSSPDDKLSYIQNLQSKGHKVLMVGDGINDVPVLAGADISMAMGNSSDLARTSADAVLISGNLERLADAFNLTTKTRRIIGQNLAWALGYNLAALPLAAAGMIAPWMAATGMALSSLIVVANALRLSRSAKQAYSPGHQHADTFTKEAVV
ncbi:heavy metal translocating P-type ATPase [Endozoicomonas ascidiicola]|uniref:heavy metal translocating P-type ATPase n=1 Tax=Endozoicomonas ascidiicola TaxID=1698521 RepID=UPI000836F339|nr:heavy metal translocating P-type ATPase [Endozoicomonas ascidiicola]